MDHHTYKEFAQCANKDSANKDSPKLPKAFTPRLFASLAKSIYSTVVFNEKSFICMYQQHSSFTVDIGGTVRCWRDVTQKYSNLTGIYLYHDFSAIKNPGAEAVMKVCELCYAGTL